MAIRNLSHITLHVRNLEKSVSFYQKLGYKNQLTPASVVDLEYIDLGPRVQFGGYRVKMAILTMGLDPRVETCLELLEVVDVPAAPKPCKPFAEVGIQRHCFRVSDLCATVESLRQQGVEIHGEPRTFDSVGAPSRYLLLTDPDDNLIELIEFVRP